MIRIVRKPYTDEITNKVRYKEFKKINTLLAMYAYSRIKIYSKRIRLASGIEMVFENFYSKR